MVALRSPRLLHHAAQLLGWVLNGHRRRHPADQPERRLRAALPVPGGHQPDLGSSGDVTEPMQLMDLVEPWRGELPQRRSPSVKGSTLVQRTGLAGHTRPAGPVVLLAAD